MPDYIKKYIKYFFRLFNALLLTIISTSIYSNISFANDFNLTINGKSFHSEPRPDNKYNEKNLGIGLQYDFTKVDKNLIPYVNAGGFSDSNGNPSYYFGGGLSHRTKFRNRWNTFHFEVGMSAFIMTRMYQNTSGSKVNSMFPGVLPTLSFGTEYTSINVVYIPETDFTKVSVWFVQLKLRGCNVFCVTAYH